MPIGYVIAKERQLVVTTASGRVTSTQFQAYHNRLLNDPDFRPEFNQLVDGTAITLLDLTLEEARAITERKVFSPASRRAFVATSADAMGITRMAQNHLAKSKTPSQIRLFPDLRSALKWLDSDDSQK